MKLLADTVIQIDLTSAGAIGASIFSGFVAAGRLITYYLSGRDAAQDKREVEAKALHKEECDREKQEIQELALSFKQQVSEMTARTRETDAANLALQAKMTSVLIEMAQRQKAAG